MLLLLLLLLLSITYLDILVISHYHKTKGPLATSLILPAIHNSKLSSTSLQHHCSEKNLRSPRLVTISFIFFLIYERFSSSFEQNLVYIFFYQVMIKLGLIVLEEKIVLNSQYIFLFCNNFLLWNISVDLHLN